MLQKGGATVSIHDVLKQTYVMKPPGCRPPPSPKPVPDTSPIFVRGYSGFDDTLLQMKLQIQEKVEIALNQFDLIFGNKRLDDDRTVKDYGLQPLSTVYFCASP